MEELVPKKFLDRALFLLDELDCSDAIGTAGYIEDIEEAVIDLEMEVEHWLSSNTAQPSLQT